MSCDDCWFANQLQLCTYNFSNEVSDRGYSLVSDTPLATLPTISLVVKKCSSTTAALEETLSLTYPTAMSIVAISAKPARSKKKIRWMNKKIPFHQQYPFDSLKDLSSPIRGIV